MQRRSEGGPRRGAPVVLALAAAVGAAAAGGVWLFKRATDAAEWMAHGWTAESWSAAPPLLVFLAPVAGGLVVGLVLHLRRIPEEPGHGVSEVIEAVTLGIHEFPDRPTPTKAVVAALSLGSGAALGPEDPSVEIGGSLGEVIGRKTGLDHDAVQSLVAAGAAGGMAAAFLAPLAAVAFAVEVFSLRLLSRTAAAVALAAGAAFLLMRWIEPAAEPRVPALGGLGWREPALCAALGAAAGAVSALLVVAMYRLEHAVVAWDAPPRWVKPAMGGAVLGAAGVAMPELLGIGYGTLEEVLGGERMALGVLLLLAGGKLALMVVSFGSGFLGGFFAPSLFVGAALGAAFGTGAGMLLPGLDAEPAAFAVVGMAALLAGSVRAPAAAVLLVVALGAGWGLLPHLAAAAVVSFVVSRALERHSLYTYGIEHPARKRRRQGGGTPERDVVGGMEPAG